MRCLIRVLLFGNTNLYQEQNKKDVHRRFKSDWGHQTSGSGRVAQLGAR